MALNLYDDETETFKAYQKDLQNPAGCAITLSEPFATPAMASYGWLPNWRWSCSTRYGTPLPTFQQSTKTCAALSSSSISSLLLDDQGILWVGTYAKGINKYDKNQFKFNLYKNFGTDALNINANIVTSFSEVPNGDIWIGTDGTGLYRWARGGNKFEAFNPAAKENYFASLSVLCMQVSRQKDYLWVGTYDEGLAKVNLKTNARTYYHRATYGSNLNNQSVYALLEDKKGNIWIGTNGGGVNVLNPSPTKLNTWN
jgi:ligand-binding sensor domain-containing protein